MLPEECVRRFWIEEMVHRYGYPKEFLLVEKELACLPHLALAATKEFPKRRIDLLVYAKREGSLVPLLMIECKAVTLHKQHAEQLIGYNVFVKAPYIAIANEKQFLVANQKELIFKEGIPHFNSISVNEKALPA